jgi:hypothetical protein
MKEVLVNLWKFMVKKIKCKPVKGKVCNIVKGKVVCKEKKMRVCVKK